MIQVRVAEVVRGPGVPRRKVWTRTKILSPNIRYFVAIYALFGDLWAKKVPFWVKNSVSWARSALLHGYMLLHISLS